MKAFPLLQEPEMSGKSWAAADTMGISILHYDSLPVCHNFSWIPFVCKESKDYIPSAREKMQF